jgi:N-acetylmuramic acid 6-phosphate etherase
MSTLSRSRSDEFLKISAQFKLGALVTEASHPVTADLSGTAGRDVAAGLRLLFAADGDVVRKYREFAASGRAAEIRDQVLTALRLGGRIFFTGCGSTGRLSILLDSVWRDFWGRQPDRETEWEHHTFSIMAGGDYALIKSVEGFEDFTAFGRQQIQDLGVSPADVVFAITEGGETSFVIGTAWAGVTAGAKVYFVYNNPDDVLCRTVERSREVIEDARIEKINLTTGPMSITGSTRMQATSIQLCVLLTVLEMVARELLGLESAPVPETFLNHLVEMHAQLQSPPLLEQLARLVALEESVYRSHHKVNYFAGRFGIDVLTDTTERSPTYCTPPFRKGDDPAATESWAFLFLPELETPAAWRHILQREPRCVEWTAEQARQLVPADKLARTVEILRNISQAELMRFQIGLAGTKQRPLRPGDGAVAIMEGKEPEAFYQEQLAAATASGAATGLIYFGRQPIAPVPPAHEPQMPPERRSPTGLNRPLISPLGARLDFRTSKAGCKPALRSRPLESSVDLATGDNSPSPGGEGRGEGGRILFPQGLTSASVQAITARISDSGKSLPASVSVFVPVPQTDLLLDGVTRVAVKLVMNALSTCTMVRLGRVMGNYMIYVVPSNLKLIDRATRYIERLTGLVYEPANRLLFEVIEYVEPRMKSDRAYPPVVGMAVLRAREGLSNEEAEQRLMERAS